MDGRMDGPMDRWTDKQMDQWTDGLMDRQPIIEMHRTHLKSVLQRSRAIDPSSSLAASSSLASSAALSSGASSSLSSSSSSSSSLILNFRSFSECVTDGPTHLERPLIDSVNGRY